MRKVLLFVCFVFAIFANAQTTIYSENFAGQNGKGATGGSSVSIDLTGVSWTIDVSNASLTAATDWFRVENERFEGRDLDGSGATWFSPQLDISNYTDVSVQLAATSQGGMEASDRFISEYKLDSGPWTEFSSNGNLNDDFNSSTPMESMLNGSNLQIRVTMTNGAGSEIHSLDNVIVEGIVAGGNPAPVISNISNNPSNPTSSDVVGVAADVTDADGLSNVEIQYGFASGVYDQAPVTMILDRGDTYFGQIPVQPDGTTVFYQIVATDDTIDPMDQETTTSPEQSYSVLDPVVTNFVAVQDFDGSLPDWSINNNQGDVAAAYGRTLDGTRISNGEIIELTSFDITGLQNLELTIHNASVGGIENADRLEVYVDLDGNGYPIDADITIQEEDTSDGSFNKSWSYDAANGNIASTIAGTPATYNGDADNGYSVIKISIPNGTTSVGVRIVAETNNNNEYFYIDDITLSEQASVIDYVYDGTSWSPTAPEGVSTTDDNVIVQSGSIAFTGDVDMNNLSLLGSATLNLGVNSLNVVGDINSPAGTSLIASDASLNLAGVDAQDINVNDVTLENLILNNANGASLNGAMNLEGVLTLSNGVLNTNDNLTLKSSSGKTAIVDQVLSGSVAGDVTVEQFYSNKRAYRLLGSTVTTSTSIFENWQQNGLNPGDMNYISGYGTQITGGAVSDGFDQSGSNAVSMFTYNNASQVWEGIPNTNATNLSPGVPYRLFLRGDRSVSLFTANAPSTSTVLKTKGALANSFVDINNLSATDGAFNFIANPYQAQVNFATLMIDADTEDINETVYYAWDPTIGDNGAYVTYDFVLDMNNVSGSEVNEFLQPGQAVFVRTAEDGNNAGLTPSIRFKQSFKTSSTALNNVYRSSNNPELITIALFRDDELASGIARDGVILKFDSNITQDSGALKLQNPDENLAINHNNNSLSILNSTLPFNGDIIDLDLRGLTSSIYTLNITNEFSQLETVWVDHYLMTETVLNQGDNSIVITVDATQPATYGAGRFSLKFNDVTLAVDDSAFAKAVTLYPNPLGDTSLQIDNLTSGNSVHISVINSLGQIVKTSTQEPYNGRVELNNLGTLNSGVYFLRIEQGEDRAVKRFIKS